MNIIDRFKKAIERAYAKGRITDAGLAKAQNIKVITASERAKIAKNKPKGNPKP
jgi:hypothetical protein